MANSNRSQDNQNNIILPNSPFILFWSIFFSLCILVYFCSAMFCLSFYSQISQIFNTPSIAASVLGFCIIDTILIINTGFVVKGKLIRNRNQNIKNYLLSPYFVLDFILVLILITRIIMQVNNQSKYSSAITGLDFGICLKFYNISRYDQVLKYYYFRKKSLALFQFCKYLVFLAFLCHVSACGFVLLDTALIQAQWYPSSELWMYSNSAFPNLILQNISTQYLYAFYFSVVTMSSVAYGDITPLNPTEVIYVICVVAFMIIFYIYIFTQIYTVVTAINSKCNEIEEDKHKVARYLSQIKISSSVRSKIISEFEFRAEHTQKTTKSAFIDDISYKLAKEYSSVSFKFDTNKLMPRFIKNIKMPENVFNELLVQTLFSSGTSYSPVQQKQGMTDKAIFYVGDKSIKRVIQTGTSTLVEEAEKNRWLGINTFLTSQHDPNQVWQVQVLIKILSLSLFQFMEVLSRSDTKLKVCHRSTYNGGVSEDMNKCLICWQGHHSSQFCLQYRPKGILLEKGANNNRKINAFANDRCGRQKIKRFYKTCKKIKVFNSPTFRLATSSTQTDINRSYSSKLSQTAKQKVWDWKYYLKEFNIPRYTNVLGTKENSLMSKSLQEVGV